MHSMVTFDLIFTLEFERNIRIKKVQNILHPNCCLKKNEMTIMSYKNKEFNRKKTYTFLVE